MLGVEPEQRKQSVELFIMAFTFTDSASSLSVTVAYQIDQLSILMTPYCYRSRIIHPYLLHRIYAWWRRFLRFFSYLNLFIFAMLNLVLAIIFCWCFSMGRRGAMFLLLIGFWYEKNSPVTLQKKRRCKSHRWLRFFSACVNLATFGSLNFSTVFNQHHCSRLEIRLPYGLRCCSFVGALGKSAQIPLYVWLPDAMAGPTPVSALIHAATMVTAGVYMVARCSHSFRTCTGDYGVYCGCGGMWRSVRGDYRIGAERYQEGTRVFHDQSAWIYVPCYGCGCIQRRHLSLMTHAFFKALLFLGSGAVIHAMHDEQDIQKMGGLKEYLPGHINIVIGAIAISGIPLLPVF